MKKKKIMLISFWASPVESSGANRINSFVKYLSKHGWQVVLIQPNVKNNLLVNKDQFFISEKDIFYDLGIKRYFINGLDINIVIKKILQFIIPGVTAVRSENKVIKQEGNTSFIRKLKNKAIFIYNKITLPDNLYYFWYIISRKKVSRVYKMEQPDVVLTSALPFSCHCYGSYLAKKFKAKWVADYRDLYVDNICLRFLNEKKKKDMELVQNKVLKGCSMITTVSERLQHAILGQLEFKYKSTVIYNGFDGEVTNLVISDESKLLKETNNDAMFLGTFYESQYDAYKLFIRVLKSSKFLRRFILSIIGNNIPDPIITVSEEVDKELFNRHVIIKGPVPFDKVKAMYRNANLLVMFDFEQDGNLSAKVFEYFTTEIPVVFFTLNIQSELAILVKQLGGIVVHPKYSIENLLKDYQSYQVNKEYMNFYRRESQATRLSTMLENLLVKNDDIAKF